MPLAIRTHFHELIVTDVAVEALSCHSMRVKGGGEVIFLHEVIAGTADQSYGVHVFAGLPPAVVARAHEVLRILEEGEQSGALARLADDLPLFSASVTEAPAAAALPRREGAWRYKSGRTGCRCQLLIGRKASPATHRPSQPGGGLP